jgi:MFS family permease
MTQTAKLDITRADQRGLTMGLNEFSGYFGVALAGIITGYMAGYFGPRLGLLIFGMAVVIVSTLLTLIWVKETIHWSRAEIKSHQTKSSDTGKTNHKARYMPGFPDKPGTMEMFKMMSFQDKRMAAFSQAGLVEKFVDALIWVFYPLYFYKKGLSVSELAWIVGIYGFVWGISQFFTGKLSDHIGRMKPIVWGMWLCAAGTGMMVLGEGVPFWALSAAITGFGMALLYPNLSAAVGDLAKPSWRGSAIGIYRFWRDLGYGIGALLLGIIANITGSITSGFIFVAVSMFLSGLLVLLAAEETHPGLNPAGEK